MDGDADLNERFTEQLKASQRQLFAYIFVLLRNLEDTQDVFQQTCLVLWNQFDQFEPGTNFTAWACKVAQFKVRDFCKVRRRYEAHLSEAFALRLAEVVAQTPAMQFDARRDALIGCIPKLSSHQREVLNLCYGSTETVAEVAEKLGRPVRSLYNSLRRIREALLDCVRRTLEAETRS